MGLKRIIQITFLGWVRCQASPLGQARQHTQQNGQRWDHSMTLRFGWKLTILKDIHVQQSFLPLLQVYDYHKRLCHIMWSRKWHNIQFKTLMTQFCRNLSYKPLLLPTRNTYVIRFVVQLCRCWSNCGLKKIQLIANHFRVLSF
jgi:hypothetical protein